MNIYEKLLGYAAGLYQKSLDYRDAKKYVQAVPVVSIATGIAAFLAATPETPELIRDQAIQLADIAADLLNDIQKSEREEYGERYLSGSSRRRDSELLDLLYRMALAVQSE